MSISIDPVTEPTIHSRAEPRRILIVEDDDLIQATLVRIISAIDPLATIERFSNGESALPVILNSISENGSPYDLIILDIYLEGKATGVELWERIFQESPRTAVLLTSSMPYYQLLKTKSPKAICPAFLEKPFKAGECRQMLEGLLGS